MPDKPKILIVDDEPFNVDYLEQELEEAGYETISAVDGQDALRKIELEAPDLILLDIMMPVMDGFEVLRRLKANPSTRDIPVVVISASNNLDSVVRGIELGAEDYLPKPFEPVLLQARLRSGLEKKRLRDLERQYLLALEREMDIAREIQQGFLPTMLPRIQGWEQAVYFKAAREVAGDFYDAFLLADGKLVIVVGDVCGKGVGAALFMTLFRSLIRAVFTTDVLAPAADGLAESTADRLRQVASFTNRYVAETHADTNMFATIFMGVLTPCDGRMDYVNCGHEPAIWLRTSGESSTLRPTGPAVGAIPEACFFVKEVLIEEGDLLLFFTDGIPDALNSAGDSFGKGSLFQFMQQGDPEPANVVQRIEARLQAFIGDAEQFDDITLMAIRRTG